MSAATCSTLDAIVPKYSREYTNTMIARTCSCFPTASTHTPIAYPLTRKRMFLHPLVFIGGTTQIQYGPCGHY